MEFLPLSRRRSSARNVHSGEERGGMDVFAGHRYPTRFFGVRGNLPVVMAMDTGNLPVPYKETVYLKVSIDMDTVFVSLTVGSHSI